MAEKKFLDAAGVKHLWEVTRLQNNENFQTNLEIFDAMAVVIETKEPKEDAAKKLVEAKKYTDDKYKESVIALTVDGRTITYITGDGESHTFETQDNDTTYTLGTDQVTGLTKLYAVKGSEIDGTMTQKAITEELNKKVSVSIEGEKLIFSI